MNSLVMECFMCRGYMTEWEGHKVGEERSHGQDVKYRHNLTTEICCRCFGLLMGAGTNFVCTTAYEAWNESRRAEES